MAAASRGGRTQETPDVIDSRKPLTTAQAARRCYPGGTHVCTVLRHITRGVKTPGGVVKLEAVRMGGRWTTTLEAIERFRAACTASREGSPPPPMTRPASQARATAFLDAIGLR